MGRSLLLLACSFGLFTGCVAPPGPAGSGAEGGRSAEASGPGGRERRDAIVVCGRRYPVDAPVRLWSEDPHYNAYTTRPRFSADGPDGLRYKPGRKPRLPELAGRVAREGWTLPNLREQVDLFVLHYDVAGTSASCFEILHDRRELSVHFLLDVDGTIYQTLDLREQAWHASHANPRSIGIEIANIGAYPPGAASALDSWYGHDRGGTVLTLPEKLGDGGVRTPGFVARPARPGRVRGQVHGVSYEQYDFTPEQYRSLVALTVALREALPGIELSVPRDARGRVRTDALSELEFERYSGLIGHQHLTERKRDPGPAFDWERFLLEVERASGSN